MMDDELKAIEIRHAALPEVWDYTTVPSPEVLAQLHHDHGKVLAEVRRLRAYEALVKKYARVIHEPAKSDILGPIHGDRTAIYLPMNFRCRETASGFVKLETAVVAAFNGRSEP